MNTTDLEQLDRISLLEKRILESNCPILDLPAIHRFTPGLYSRTVMLKQGSVWTTRIHKTEHQFAISSGRVSVYTEGQGVSHIEAPFVGITKPGAHRVIYVHQDTMWTTFHPTTETNIEKLEELLVEPYAEHLRERHSLQPSLELLQLTGECV